MASNRLHEATVAADRRSLLRWTGALAGATGMGLSAGWAQPPRQSEAASSQPEIRGKKEIGGLRKGMFSFMLASEQFSTPDIIRLGARASRAGLVVGDRQAANQAAEFWRFGPKAFKTLYNVPSPVAIQHNAEAEAPIDEVLASRAVGSDSAVHIRKMHELFDSGVSIINVHSGQPDQARVIDFYAEHVLPVFKRPV
jgi:hypothetical protein